MLNASPFTVSTAGTSMRQSTGTTSVSVSEVVCVILSVHYSQTNQSISANYSRVIVWLPGTSVVYYNGTSVTPSSSIAFSVSGNVATFYGNNSNYTSTITINDESVDISTNYFSYPTCFTPAVGIFYK